MPPMRKACPCGALPAATSVGEKKKAMLLWRALSTSRGGDAENGQAAARSGRCVCDGFHLLVLSFSDFSFSARNWRLSGRSRPFDCGQDWFHDHQRAP
jgi:hypothetical protein